MLAALGTSGVFTPIIESAAAAIGAGVVIGGFVGASAGVRHGLSRKEVERSTLRDSYFGAVWVLAFWILDQCIVYAT
jgi:hypothetical protein